MSPTPAPSPEPRAAFGRTAALVAAALALVLVAAILLAPGLHAAGMALGLTSPERFPKTLRRLVVVAAVAVVFLLFKPWRDGGLASYGLTGPRARWRPGVLGYLGTAGALLLVLGVHVAVGWVLVDDPIDRGELTKRLLKWLPVGVAIAIAEEWFFRGWMDRRLRRGLGPLGAALAVAGTYAVLHLFEGHAPGEGLPATVGGALAAIGEWAGRLTDSAYSVPAFVGLFLFSLVLSAAWRRTGTLWTAIGIHAAGIFVLKTYGALTERVPVRTWAGTKDVYDGPPGWAVLLVVLVLLAPRARGVRGGAQGHTPD